MTPEDQQNWINKKRHTKRIWKQTNRDKQLESVRKWKKSNPEKLKQGKIKWNKENSEKVKEHARKGASNLTDYYIAARLDIPVRVLANYPELAESKREQIQILRELKKQTENNNAQEPQ